MKRFFDSVGRNAARKGLCAKALHEVEQNRGRAPLLLGNPPQIGLHPQRWG